MSTQCPPIHILATIEDTDTTMFHEHVQILFTSGRIARVIVDEAHLVSTHDGFRNIMDTLEWIGRQGCQVVIQTASAPITLEPELFKKIGISLYVVCRDQTSRPNISYKVVRAKPFSLHETFDQIFHEAMSSSTTNRVLVYCQSREDAEETARWLGITHCHSGVDKDEVNAILDQLRAGTIRAVIATALLGVALDVPDVSHVLHLDYPWDTISYIQESGCAGRKDGSKVYSIIVIPNHTVHSFPNPDCFGARLIHEWADNNEICHRWLLSVFNDGVGEACTMMCGVCHLCDYCERVSNVVPERRAPTTMTADMITPYIR
jgi:superfamily II DNA helicase RecQ